MIVGINDDTIKHAEDVAKAALWALRKAAEMAQGVPYLSVISSALRTFIEIRDVRYTSVPGIGRLTDVYLAESRDIQGRMQ